jgi:hypothetical protein
LRWCLSLFSVHLSQNGACTLKICQDSGCNVVQCTTPEEEPPSSTWELGRSKYLSSWLSSPQILSAAAVVGVLGNADIYPVKILGSSGVGSKNPVFMAAPAKT